jgi:hypothetical protein
MEHDLAVLPSALLLPVVSSMLDNIMIKKVKDRAVSLQAWSDPEGSRKLRFPRFRDNGTGWRLGWQPYAPAAFTPRKCSWYSFLLEAESTPVP